MFRKPSSWVLTLIVLMLAALGTVVFGHYGDAYGVRLHVPNESWLHETPRTLAAAREVPIGEVQDRVYFVTSEAEIVAMTITVPLMTSAGREPFERGFAKGLGERTGSRVARCRGVKTDEANWSCFEWVQVREGVPVRFRTYLSGRGVTKAVVMFAAHADDFGIFGSPQGWLDDVEWRGPSLLYAL